VREALLPTVRRHDPLEAALATVLPDPVRSAASTKTSSAWWTPKRASSKRSSPGSRSKAGLPCDVIALPGAHAKIRRDGYLTDHQ